jgi:heterodisulfide reductase subunit A2
MLILFCSFQIYLTAIIFLKNNKMDKKKNLAVYFSYPLNGNIDHKNIEELEVSLTAYDEVKVVWNSNSFNFSEKDHLIGQLINYRIERIILVGEKPGFTKSYFSELLSAADKDPTQILMIDFQSYFDDQQSFDLYAKSLLRSAILDDKPFKQVKDEKNLEYLNETLIIGAGIAGIQASLEIAKSKNKVYLLEKSGTIGGHMAQFDKTFPTLDCAACILTPKMVDVGQHPSIELLTNSEVISISGRPGKFKIKILKHARRVSLSTCIGCGICAEKCPSKTQDEFDQGTSLRKAIYIPFPQAVPNKYLIDPENCTYVQNGKCGVCAKVCPADAINLDETDEYVEIMVGDIILATGFKPFDAKKIERFGYGKFPNVLTSLEFERLLNASGPTEGEITFRSQDKKGNWLFKKGAGEPRKVAIIHCVGSRDEQHHSYCSRVCCMYSLKLAHLVKEKIPEAEVSEYYIDMRAYGKGYEEFYKRIEDEGVHLIRGRTARIDQINDRLLLRSEDILNDRMIESEVDMVVLSVGLEPSTDTKKLASIAGIQVSKDGWFKELDSAGDTECTHKSGIFIAGACQGPKDIPDSVAQGSAAAALVLQNIMSGKTMEYQEIHLDKIIESEFEQN